MMLNAAQVSVIFTLTFLYAECKKPPGYVEKPKEYDPDPPNYEYGYRIEYKKGNHGRDEKREGIFAEGRYYVHNPDSNHDVKYFTDNWGYHPIVEYSNTGPHSKSSASFILDVEALKYQKSGKIPDKEALMENANLQPQNKATDNENQPPVENDPAKKQSASEPLKDPPTVQVEDAKPMENLMEQSPVIQPESNPATSNRPNEPDQPEASPPPTQTPVCCLGGKNVCCFPQYKQPQVILLPTSPKILDLLQGEYFRHTPALTNSVEKNVENIDRSFDKHDDYQNFLESFFESRKYKSKLIESTKDMVTGADVININQAAANGKEQSSSTLLENHVIPATQTNSTAKEQLLAQPIVAAESSEEKPVTENNIEPLSVTPKEVSTKFLAPVTVGMAKLVTEEAKQTKDRTEGEVSIEVQKSMPYYLGKYEYPMEYVAENAGKATAEVKASEDIELGKTLLYFTDGQETKGQMEATKGMHGSYPLPLPVPQVKNMVEKPMEKIIEEPMHLPVQATKYPVKVPFPQHYPVEKMIEELQPVEVKIPGKLEQKTETPYYFERSVEKIIEKPYFIDRHYHPREPQVYYVNLPWQSHQAQEPSHNIQHVRKPAPQHPNVVYYLNHPFTYSPQPSKPKLKINQLSAGSNNGYLPPKECVHHQPVHKNEFNLKNGNDYFGLAPPKYSSKYDQQFGRSFRQARSSFNAKSIKMEYGFMPPLIPSLEIDEQGQPIEKSDSRN